MAEYILPTPLRRVYIMADAGMITYTSFAIDGVRLGDLYLWLGPPDHIQRYKGGAAIYWSSPPAVARMYTSGSAIKVDLLRQVHFMALINPG